MMGFQYVVLRCVPRVDREEFLNAGVVLYCQQARFLRADCLVDAVRLHALDPTADPETVRSALAAVSAVCAGEASAGAAGKGSLGTRFGFLAAPRSTVIQPGPVHGGLTADPEHELAHLMDRLVRCP